MTTTGQPILLVEDDTELRDVLTVLLELNGYEVVGAADGIEALTLLRGGLRPGMIVFDLMMPNKPGWEFRAEQLADPELAAIPSVAVSAAVRGENLKRALQVETFLPKPLDVDTLLALAAKHCPRASSDAS
ncbi:MAG TPA: response regulator [Candidatus Binatia bacterium]|nr:response regulator [Candidatus Binatia bacterium]